MGFLVLGLFELWKARHEDDFLDFERLMKSLIKEGSDFGLNAVGLRQFGNEYWVITKRALSLIEVLLSFVNGIPDENKSEHDDDEGRDSKHRLKFINVSIYSGHQYKNSSAVPMVSIVALHMASFVWFFK